MTISFEDIKKNIFNILLTTMVGGILWFNWGIYTKTITDPDKWSKNKAEHEVFNESLDSKYLAIDALKDTVRNMREAINLLKWRLDHEK